ncbi:phosphonate utilization associated transcriptional regulator [Acidovorax sp. SUPP2522]|uniref:phosphonate utilization associated transcriptional regulator n=1 Tax=unclassified Acidovorax TaxID=2684926 RepID=UPI00234A8428|nr:MULTISPECIES: phosphonate utilization associated transcriptional regulator [unclassified Acidovorax]WCM96170.1 phosphonate utilization associated transcriptional regulator [Acidovorax sp. GBBC 1281]GKT15398.1 phosphonate utilization associated transcriptional regulator [Acidovorax sp. SUPP2522]
MAVQSPANAAIAQLQGNSLAGLVQNEIERMILASELQPGEKLTESTLATRLGVSRGPVREAFRMLDEAGLVRTEKNRGVFVRDIALDEALEIFELRAVMEMYIGRKLAETCTAAQTKALRRWVDAMDAATKAGNAQDFHRFNLEFHDALLQLAGNAKFTAHYRRLIKELSLIRRRNLTVESMAVYTREHRQIVKAIAARNAEAAGQAMFDHVMNSRERTLQNYRPAPEASLATPAPVRRRTTRATAEA